MSQFQSFTMQVTEVKSSIDESKRNNEKQKKEEILVATEQNTK